MPYIDIKAYPKDEATKKEVAEKINQIFLELWGCSQEAISINIEEYTPEAWEKEVFQAEVEPKKDKMLIFSGRKNYEK